MPNRIVKESIRTSKKVNALSDFQYRLWSYLITYVDDYGRGSADPAIIKGFVFPLRSNVTEKSIQNALCDLATMGMIHLYEVEGDSFLCFPSWDKHQRIRQKVSRFPAPEEAETTDCDGLRQVAADCGNSRQTAAGCGLNPNPNTNPNPNPNVGAEAASGSLPADFMPPPEDMGEPEILLPLNDGTEHPIYPGQVLEWCSLYPSVDIRQELRNMRGWLLSNRTRRKTRRGIEAFCTSWLAREQNKAKPARKPEPQNVSFLDLARMMEEEA